MLLAGSEEEGVLVVAIPDLLGRDSLGLHLMHIDWDLLPQESLLSVQLVLLVLH